MLQRVTVRFAIAVCVLLFTLPASAQTTAATTAPAATTRAATVPSTQDVTAAVEAARRARMLQDLRVARMGAPVPPAELSPEVAAEVAKALEPTLITLNVQGVPAMKALEQLSKLSGFEIRPYDNRVPRFGNVSVSLAGEPFWEVFRNIGAQVNINLYSSNGEDDRRIRLAPANWGGQPSMKAPTSVKGPFLVVANNLNRVNTVHMATPQTVSRNLQIQVYIFVEPKLRVTQISNEPTIEEAVDDNGNQMQGNVVQRDNMQGGRGICWYGYFQLPYPPTNPGKKIARIKGHFAATLQMQSEPIEIANPVGAAETTKTIAGKKVTFKSLQKIGDRYAAEMVFYRGDEPVQQFYNTFNDMPSMRLVDAQGRTYQAYNSGSSADGEKATRKFDFRNRGGTEAAGAPVKLIIEIPTAVQNIPIPFELTNLPMP